MKKTSTWITIVVILLVLIIGISWWYKKHDKNDANVQNNSSSSQNTSAGNSNAASSTTATGTNPVSNVPTSSNLSYNQALAIYGKSGYRIQFSQCHGTPGKLSIRQGVKFMLDNRDNKAHTIVIKSATYHLGSYGFAIVSASELGTYNITCDGGGAAQLNVEK